MTTDEREEHAPAATALEPKRLRLPGFLVEGELGLGDALKGVTSRFHVRPCGACEQRAASLNAWLVFVGPERK